MLIMQNRAQRYDISLVYKNFRTFIVALSRKKMVQCLCLVLPSKTLF